MISSHLPQPIKCPIRAIALACLAVAATATHAQTTATPYLFRHLAGAPGGPGKADGSGLAARFNYATGVAADQAGNVYVTDSHAETIRKITPDGTVTTIAGAPTVAGSTDGVGSAARFSYPTGPAIDASGNLFVADWANDTIRKVTPAGMVTTFAGSAKGRTIPNGDNNGVGPAAKFWGPSSVAVDASGNLFVADSGNEEIRKITPDGTVTRLTLSGPPDWPIGGLWHGEVFGSDSFARSWDSQYTNDYLSQITIDRAGNLYCGNYQWAPSSYGIPSYHMVLKIDPSGAVSTISQFPTVTTLVGPTVDKLGQLLIGTPSGLLRMDTSGAVSSLTGTTGISGVGLTVTPAGDCIVADYEQILKISPSGNIGILAGLPATPGTADGTGAAARFNSPGGIAVDAGGNIYVADTVNSTVRKITPAGVVTTLAGQAGGYGQADGTGPAAQFFSPDSIAVDSMGMVFVRAGSSIRKITPAGVVSTLAGVGISPLDHGLAMDTAGNLYFRNYSQTQGAVFPSPDKLNKLTPAGVLSEVATIGPDNIGGLAMDHSGNLYVTQTSGRVVLKIDSKGTVTTFAGSGGMGTADGPGSNAQFTTPTGVAVDNNDNVFVTDGNAIRQITPDGVVTTVGGLATSPGSEDGIGADAQFNGPTAITVDAAGKIYVADTSNHSIRIGELAGAPVVTVQPQNQTAVIGATAQFSVTASGLPAPTYQWYLNGIAFNGATASTLSFTGARSADAGDYTVVVTNALGSVTSSKATLTVSAAPVTTPAAPASGSGGGTIGAGLVFALLVLRAMCGNATTHKLLCGKNHGVPGNEETLTLW